MADSAAFDAVFLALGTQEFGRTPQLLEEAHRAACDLLGSVSGEDRMSLLREIQARYDVWLAMAKSCRGQVARELSLVSAEGAYSEQGERLPITSSLI